MIGNHPDIGLLVEDWRDAYQRIVSKKITGNKLCIPNQIELQCRLNPWINALRRLGLMQNVPGSTLGIEDYMRQDNCQLLAIIRDGNDVIASIRKRGKQALKTAGYRWARAMEIVETVLQEYPGRVHLTSYEHLVNEPERVLGSICAFLEVDFHQQMLEGYKYNPIYKEGQTQIHKEKAHRHQAADLDFNLETLCPEAMRLYEKLNERAGNDV